MRKPLVYSMVATMLPRVFVFDVNNVARWQQCFLDGWQLCCLLATTPSVGNNVNGNHVAWWQQPCQMATTLPFLVCSFLYYSPWITT